jgi:hypothetical protein
MMRWTTRWSNWKLRRERRKLHGKIDRLRTRKDLTVAEENKSSELSRDLYRLTENIRTNIMLDVLDRAEKLGIYTPATLDVSSTATDDVVSRIRALIRTEEEERRTIAMARAKIAGIVAAIITALVGAGTGFIAVFRK